jgi:hypothetical protein
LWWICCAALLQHTTRLGNRANIGFLPIHLLPPSLGAITKNFDWFVCVLLLLQQFSEDFPYEQVLSLTFIQPVRQSVKVFAMSEYAGTGGMPLDQYSDKVPPGWKIGLPHYPFRRYLERLRLFYRMTSLSVIQCGPAVAGRLVGRPYNMALKLRIECRNGVVLFGDDALAFEGTPAMGALAPEESGLQQLIRLLSKRYGADSDNVLDQALDNFFDLRRGQLSLNEYLSEFDYCYDEAHDLAGLEVNDNWCGGGGVYF